MLSNPSPRSLVNSETRQLREVLPQVEFAAELSDMPTSPMMHALVSAIQKPGVAIGEPRYAG